MSITPQQLLESALTRHRGVLSCDIVFGDDAGASVGHDDREAPFVMDGESGEQQGILISITDEDAERLCAIVRVAEDSDVLGIGIDLASTEDWHQDERGERFAELLFTVGENALISAAEEPVPLLRAKAFSAKEAAFKSTAAALRRWYESHDEELYFEARDFELVSWGESRGTARKGRAATACEKLGISRIETSFSEYAGMAFCVAVAC